MSATSEESVSKRERRVSRKRSLIASGVMLCGLALVPWMVGGSLVTPHNQTKLEVPQDLAVEPATISSQSGTSLAAWYIPAEAATSTIVLVHPLHGSRSVMLDRARIFHQSGHAVVMIDLQAHGESPGEAITMGHLERHDVAAAVEFARKRNPEHRIAVVGWSLGGAAAVLASPLGIDALVLESVYPTISQAVENRIEMRLGSLAAAAATPLLLWQLKPRLGITRADLRPIEKIGAVGCPVLIISGNQDRRTTLEETQALFAAAAEPKKLAVIAGAGHCDLLAFRPEAYRRHVLEFLNRHLRGTFE